MTLSASTPAGVNPTALPLPQLRAARPRDYAQIEALESSHGLLTLIPEDWQRMWQDNPLIQKFPDRWPIGWVLEDAAGKIVGSLANIPTLYKFRGKDLVAVTGRGWVVLHEYRGVALWLMDEYFNQENADLFINSTVNSMAVDPFSAFGSERVPLGDWETATFWITNYCGFARTALRIKHVPLPSLLALPAAALLRVKDVALRKLPTVPSGIEIAGIESFDTRFDLFWNELVAQSPEKLLAVRDARTLTWHFAGPLRTRHCWILTASRGGSLRAYAIFKRQDHPPSGLVRMRLVDYNTLEPGQNLLLPLVHAAIRRCKSEGIHVLEQVGRQLPKTELIDQFAPYERKLPAWPFYFHASDPAVHETLRRPEAWDPSSYDGDASL